VTAAGFFAIGTNEWTKACALGLNPAVAFLVLARGSGRDNMTTSWSADAVANHTGMSWRRAKAAIDALESENLASVTRGGARPSRKLSIPKDLVSALWLPNALVDGAGNEVPPVTRLRQAQNLEHLQTFIELYGLQDMAGDGGLPRSLICTPFERERICDTGQFRVWGFTQAEARNGSYNGPLARFAGRKENEQRTLREFIGALECMGLLETVDYLAEGQSGDAELLHPLTGDAEADKVHYAAELLPERMPEWFAHKGEQFHYVLPVIRHIAKPAVVGVSRLVYRPHTKLTAAWYARHKDTCERFAAIYNALAMGDFKQAAKWR
jgi:hypothetical protein